MINPANYSSHIPVLLYALGITEGPVLEMGVGFFSTPLIHWLCVPHGRKVMSMDNNKQFCDSLKPFAGPLHEIELVRDWEGTKIKQPWGLAFVDHEPPKRRKIDVARLAEHARLIVLHDTSPEQNRVFEYDEVWPLFKYVYHHYSIFPGTSMLSNFMELENVNVAF